MYTVYISAFISVPHSVAFLFIFLYRTVSTPGRIKRSVSAKKKYLIHMPGARERHAFALVILTYTCMIDLKSQA